MRTRRGPTARRSIRTDGGSRLSALVHDLTADDDRLGDRARDVFGSHPQNVPGQHHEVGKLADGQ